MQKKCVSIVLVALMLAVTVAPIPSTAQTTSSGVGFGLTVPVTGQARSGGRINGTFTIEQFVQSSNPATPFDVAAVGTLVLQTANGRIAVTKVTMPVQLANGGSSTSPGVSALAVTCPILDLTLGPLDLNLLGLEIHLDQVHLTIDANPAGGLLGQLLCAIANLLTPTTLQQLINLLNALNDLLAALGGLGLPV